VMQGHIGNAQVPSGGNRGTGAPSSRSGEFHNQQGPSGNAERSAGTAASGSPQGNAGDHGGWTKFGSPSSRANDSTRSGPSGPASRDNTRVPAGNSSSDVRSNAGPGAASAGRSVDRNNGGWQRFPSNSSPGSRGNDTRQNDTGPGHDRSSSPPSKPTLELNKPIVTPRESPGPSPSGGNERTGPPQSSSRGADVRGGGGSHERGGGGGSHERGGGGGGERGSKNR
jgi:hypothetical protein